MPEAYQSAVEAFKRDLKRQAAELQSALPKFAASVEGDPMKIAKLAAQMDQVKTAVKTIALLDNQLNEWFLEQPTIDAIEKQRQALKDARDAWPGDVEKIAPKPEAVNPLSSFAQNVAQTFSWAYQGGLSLYQRASASISGGGG